MNKFLFSRKDAEQTVSGKIERENRSPHSGDPYGLYNFTRLVKIITDSLSFPSPGIYPFVSVSGCIDVY